MSNHPTYDRLLELSQSLGFKLLADWENNTLEVAPRGISRGGTFRLDLSTSPEDAEKQFRAFYSLSEREDKPLVRKPRKVSRIKEIPDGSKEGRKKRRENK